MTTRNRIAVLALAGLAAGAVRCASYKPIAVTTDAAAVSSCQKVDDLALRNDRSYDDPVKSLIEEARAKGANTLLYEPAPDGGMKHGVAYQCALPPAAQKPQP